jgi:hypothetical protein
MKKQIFAVLAVLVLLFAVISCEQPSAFDNSVQIERETFDSVSNVTVTKTTDNEHFIVAFEAVEEAPNGYSIYIRQEDSDTYVSMGVSAQNMGSAYDTANGDVIANTDFNMVYAILDSSDFDDESMVAGNYFFGVRTNGQTKSSTNNDFTAYAESDIEWADDPTAFTSATVTSFSAALENSNSDILFTLNLVGSDDYDETISDVKLYVSDKGNVTEVSSASLSTFTQGTISGGVVTPDNTSSTWYYQDTTMLGNVSSSNGAENGHEYKWAVLPDFVDVSVIGTKTFTSGITFYEADL